MFWESGSCYSSVCIKPQTIASPSVSDLSGNVSLRMHAMDFLSHSDETLTCKCYLSFLTDNIVKIFEENAFKSLIINYFETDFEKRHSWIEYTIAQFPERTNSQYSLKSLLRMFICCFLVILKSGGKIALYTVGIDSFSVEKGKC